MKKSLLILMLFFGISFVGKSQTIITWDICKDVQFNAVWSEEFQAYYMVPKFGKKVSSLDGKEIQIRGYIIPVDIVQDYYVLSANPYSSCFFCGQAGPESVMEIQLKKQVSGMRMDQILTFKGKLRLNADDIYELNYILEDAVVVE